jgi:hypothetical protein
MGGDEPRARSQAAFDLAVADQRLDVFAGLAGLAVDGERGAVAIAAGELAEARLGHMAE